MHPAVAPPPAPARLVTRVLRASQSRVNGSVMDELFLARARACGPQRVPGLCGSLLYSGGWFVLWLEGDAAAIDSVLKRSARHACHSEPRIIHRSVGPATLCEPLTLATTQGPETPAEFTLRIDAAAKSGASGPGEIWRMLSEPCTLAECAEPAAIPRRIALVASDDNHSVDIVRKVADRFRRPMVYQRFAGSDVRTRDFGAVYVDVPVEGVPTRVQLFSRRALSLATVHKSLRGVQSLALLLGPRPSSAIDLAASVAGAMDPRLPPAAIELVGECPEVARTVTDYLSRHLGTMDAARIFQLPAAKLLDFLVGTPSATRPGFAAA